MGDDLEYVIRQILLNHRHLMTEAERRADRAFYFQEKAKDVQDPAVAAELTAATQQALSDDPHAAALFRNERACFLENVARRILAEHGNTLPRCAACGGLLRTPSPKLCFDCDYQAPPKSAPAP